MTTYLLTWEEHGVPHASHHSHRIVVDRRQAASLLTACSVEAAGNAELLASMAEAGR